MSYGHCYKPVSLLHATVYAWANLTKVKANNFGDSARSRLEIAVIVARYNRVKYEF